MKTRNYAPAMGPAAGVRVFLNNFFRILRLFTLILLSASQDLTVSGGGGEQKECEPACRVAAVGRERSGAGMRYSKIALRQGQRP